MRLHFLPLLAPVLLAACSYSKNLPPSTNGSEHELFFSQVIAANLGVVPIGVSRTVNVWRNSGGTVECHGLGTGSAGDVSIQGGHPDLPSDTCGTIAAEQVTLESATCDDDACTITSEEKGKLVVLHVTAKSKEAKPSRLHVALKKASDATVWHDSIAVSFAPADRIELSGSFTDLAPLRLPILTGVAFSLPIARVVDANDKAMSIDDDTLKETLTGNGVIEDNDAVTYSPTVIAKKPGKASVKWELPGAIERVIELEVVDRTEARSIALFAVPVSKDPAALSTDLDTLTAETLSPKDGLETILFTTYYAARSTYATRVRLADGRSALAPIDSVTVEPATLLRPSLAGGDWSMTLAESATPTAGTGTVTVESAGLTQTWPITVTVGQAQK